MPPEHALPVVSRGLRCAAVMACVLAGTPPALTAQPSTGPLSLLDVPYVSQTQALCGGAAAAMVLRFWGERGVSAESFAHLVDHSAAGIRTDALIDELRMRGWTATGVRGDAALAAGELARGRPVVALIEDRPGVYHYVVVVARLLGVVVFHDPARLPFRVMRDDTFARQWRAAGSWMAVIVPGDGRDVPQEPSAPSTVLAGTPDRLTGCDAQVSAGVRHAQDGELDAAERVLAGALSCEDGAAFRELAGVRLLQRRWPEVAELAGVAVARDATDGQAWRLLATSRFVEDDPRGALEAWNQVGEPRLDLVQVDGIWRTRQRVVEALLGVPAGTIVTPDTMRLARRRLAELPAARATRLDYVPAPGGLVELRAGVMERPAVPATVWEVAAVGVMAAARREVHVASGSPTGSGERVSGSWRFWPGRPAWGAEVAVPAGTRVVRAELFVERQPFDSGLLAPGDRMLARAGLGGWIAPGWRVGVDAGAERRPSMRALAVVGGRVVHVSGADRVRLTFDLDRWMGPVSFARAYGAMHAQTAAAPAGLVLHAGGGAGAVSRRAPPDLYFAGDTGHVGPVLLRAHPALAGGALRVSRLSRTVAHATVEARHWWRGPAGTRLAAAAFLDAARGDGGVSGAGPGGAVDAGLGARIAVPGLSGVLRLDVARGLRDRASAISFVYEP